MSDFGTILRNQIWKTNNLLNFSVLILGTVIFTPQMNTFINVPIIEKKNNFMKKQKEISKKIAKQKNKMYKVYIHLMSNVSF